MGVVLGLVLVAIGGTFALNLGRAADQFADHAAAMPRPPYGFRGAPTEPGQYRLFGAVFVVIGVLAIAAALGLRLPL